MKKECEVLEKISQTKHSCLYRVKRDGLFYILKTIDENLLQNTILEKEANISKDIENYCNKSVCIPIFHIEEREGKYYAVMQFKKNGLFLSEMIDRLEMKYEIIPTNIQVEILEAILISLKALHSCPTPNENRRGYLHLDLHPDNVFFESISLESLEQERFELGAVKFIDWQNALTMELDGVATSEGNMGVTQGYTSPEHKYKRKFTKASDLYSVAAIGARMYTGKKNLMKEIESYYEIIKSDNYPVCDNPVVQYLMKSVLKCGLEANPAYRYQYADEMMEAFNRIRKCIYSFEDYNYYNLFENAFMAKVPANKIQLKEFEFDEEGFQEAIHCLDKSLHQSNIKIEQVYYIALRLIEMAAIFDTKIEKQDKGKLWANGIACYNHMGQTEEARKLILKCSENKNLADFVNLVAENHADCLEFEEALKMVCEYSYDIELDKEQARKRNRNPGKRVELGRAYSASGRYMAFLKGQNKKIELYESQKENKVSPIDMFEKALEEFEDDKNNYHITMAHMLQYALQEKDKELFFKYAVIYFGDYEEERILETWLRRLLKERDTSGTKKSKEEGNIKLYDFCLLFKAIYTFYSIYPEDSRKSYSEQYVTSEFINILKEEIINKDFFGQCFVHPTQFIYKYIALILHEYRQRGGEIEVKKEEIGKIFEGAFTIKHMDIDVNKPMTILTAISYQTRWIYNRICFEGKGNDDLLIQIKQHSQNPVLWNEMFQLLKHADGLEELLGYEYN